MATTNIKRIVGQAIATYIASNVTGLQGRVSAVQEGPEKVSDFPSVCLLPSGFSFMPSDPDEVFNNYDAGNAPLVLDIGEFTGLLEMQLYANSVPMRELYEQRILDLFLSQQGSPGTLFVQLPTLTINGQVTLYGPEVKVRLDNEEWKEEFSFESRRYSFMDLSVAWPALTTVDAPTITDLQVGFTEDLDSNVAMEIVTVQEDGSVS
jgi:hypothetical protein